MNEMMISADEHIDLGYLPRDLWTERLPKSLKDRAPHVEDKGEEGDFWVCEGQLWNFWAGGRYHSRTDRLDNALDRVPGEDYVLRPTTPHLRLADMERDGVEASVLFPPIIPMTVSDRELEVACVQAYNDWVAEFSAAAPGRFLPVAMLFPGDPQASKDEAMRVAKLGLRQVNFMVAPDFTNQIYSEEWDLFWDAVEEAGLILSYHIGGGGPLLGTLTRTHTAQEGRQPIFGMGIGNGGKTIYEPFVGLFTSAVLERHPNLRFVMAEFGTGWVPYVVQEMDYCYQKDLGRGWTPKGVTLKMLPSEVFRRQVWCTYQADLAGLHLVEFFGEGHIMWASDYPHKDSTWPNSREVVERETAHLSPEMKKRIIRDNAREFYGLGVSN